MKKLVVMALALILVGGAAFGLDVSFAAGPKAGVNLGWGGGSDYNDRADDADGKGIGIGFAAGAFLEAAFSEQFSVQPELLFFQWKSKTKGPDDDTVSTANSLTIPILAKGTFPVGQGSVFVLGGPAVAFILGDVTTDTGDTETDLEPDNATVFAAALGVGYEQPLGPGSISAELRYSRVLSKVFDDDEFYFQAASVLVGYGFSF